MKEREENPIRNIRGQRKGSSIFGSTSEEGIGFARISGEHLSPGLGARWQRWRPSKRGRPRPRKMPLETAEPTAAASGEVAAVAPDVVVKSPVAVVVAAAAERRAATPW